MPAADISNIQLPAGGAVLGVGVDMESVSRIRSICERQGERFLKRVYTEAERAYCMGMKHPHKHLAVRFAAKEAVAKAFTTGIGEHLNWTSVSVERGRRGEPMVVLDSKGKRLLEAVGGARVAVSLAHTDDHAIAFAVVVGAQDSKGEPT